MNENDEKVLHWLIDSGNPPVRYLTLINLLHRAPHDTEVRAAKADLMVYSVTTKILQNYDRFSEIDDKAYLKYTGFYWQLIFLGQFLADGKHPKISAMAEKLLQDRRWISTQGGQCLTANLLTSLINLGYAEHPVVVAEVESLAGRYLKDGGIDCRVMDYSLLPACYMALPKLLLCFSAFGAVHSSAPVRRAVLQITEQLLTQRIAHYVPQQRNEWNKILAAAPKKADLPTGSTVKEWVRNERSRFSEKFDLSQRTIKKGWLKFGFPLHYNSDLLEAMYALALAGTKMNDQLDEALQLIIGKRTDQGTWLLENSLNGKMLADVETVGRPSKWLTYFALFVLDHFSGRKATNPPITINSKPAPMER